MPRQDGSLGCVINMARADLISRLSFVSIPRLAYRWPGPSQAKHRTNTGKKILE